MANKSSNRFVTSLPASDRVKLLSLSKMTTLEHAHQLQEQGGRIEHVYFPISGIISLLATMEDGRAVEVAMIGQNGAVDLAAGLGRMRATTRAVVQAPGVALRIGASAFQKLSRQSPVLTATIFTHQELLLSQVQQAVACNCLHDAEKRLARWLLQAHDLVGKDQPIPFTQEFLSNILGVTRPTVTLVATSLQRSKLIGYRRGRIEVLDRRAFEHTACECYRAIRKLTVGLK
jgi:CRP-like cAMP-binding protein